MPNARVGGQDVVRVAVKVLVGTAERDEAYAGVPRLPGCLQDGRSWVQAAGGLRAGPSGYRGG